MPVTALGRDDMLSVEYACTNHDAQVRRNAQRICTRLAFALLFGSTLCHALPDPFDTLLLLVRCTKPVLAPCTAVIRIRGEHARNQESGSDSVERTLSY